MLRDSEAERGIEVSIGNLAIYGAGRWYRPNEIRASNEYRQGAASITPAAVRLGSASASSQPLQCVVQPGFRPANWRVTASGCRRFAPRVGEGYGSGSGRGRGLNRRGSSTRSTGGRRDIAAGVWPDPDPSMLRTAVSARKYPPPSNSLIDLKGLLMRSALLQGETL
jgi:hypothetical protein